MKVIELNIPLDPDDERYRQCPYCGREFMTAHRARKFCGQYCHDHFHADKRQQVVELTESEPLPAQLVVAVADHTKEQEHQQEHHQENRQQADQGSIPSFLFLRLVLLGIAGVIISARIISMHQD